MQVHPYLNFDGTTEQAFQFYRSVFGGDFSMFQRFKDTPACGSIPAAEQNRVMHVALPLPGGAVLMGSDTMPSMGHRLSVGNNCYICLMPESKAEADRIFGGLSAGGTIETPMQDMFWGAYWGCLRDRFGIQWMVNVQTAPAHATR
jgi:PhnB protein